MTCDDITKLWNTLRDEFGLFNWTLIFDVGPQQRLGQCRYGPREIGLTKWYVELNELDVVEDTLRHEIAHALTPGAGHGAEWRAMCDKVGCDPYPNANFDRWPDAVLVAPDYNYIATCRACGKVWGSNKQKQGLCSCVDGWPKEEAILEWEPNPNGKNPKIYRDHKELQDALPDRATRTSMLADKLRRLADE